MPQAFDPKRFEALVRYVAHATADDETFGRTKLAKVLFYSDFDVYRDTGEPLTGATYVRRPFGPFPKELRETEMRLQAEGVVTLEHDVGEREPKRILPRGECPDMTALFEGWQLVVVDRWIEELRPLPAWKVSDVSHEHPGWILARDEWQEINYGTAFLPREPPSYDDTERAERVARERGWLTDAGWIWERTST